ncbi:MAG: hypothetical protein JW755_12570, partial [Candidatus Aminicenantes bacterium]|nr:hypothetical protein [Candidatus Aminicenantes bacterium]
GWEFKGTDFIQVDAVLKKNGRLNFSSDLKFKKYGLQNQDSSCIGENLSATIKANGEMDLQKLHLNGKAVMDIREGEILYDVFYLDLNKSPFFSSCKAEYDIPQKSLSFNKTSLGLKGILNSEAHGVVLKRPEDLNISLAVSVPKTNLKPGFNAFVLEPFKSEKPFLNDLNIDGQFSADLILNKKEGKLELLGHFLLQDAIFSSHDEGVSLDGVDLDLPMHYQTGNRLLGKIPGKGKLKVDKMDIPWLPEQPLSMTLEAGPNSLKVPYPTTIKIPGGEVQIGPVICRDIFGPQLSILTDLEITSVDIKPVLSRFWPRSVEGKISGKLDAIHFQGNKITSSG